MEYNRLYNMGLPTIQYQPVSYVPIEYEPIQRDYSKLASVFAANEARRKEAAQTLSAIDMAYAKVEENLYNTPEMNEWLSAKKQEHKAKIQAIVDRGDPALAINMGIKEAARPFSDSEFIGRVKASQEYKSKVDETHKRVLAGQISPDTERWWLANNQFKYEDVVDDNGQIIGGTSYSTLEVPVADINIAELTQNAFKLISPKATDSALTKEEGTSTHYKHQWVTRQQIVDNLNEILDDTPGARTAMYQRYQVEMNNYKELLNNPEADAGRITQQRDRVEKNGSPMTFEEFCVREIEQSAISQNLAYDYKTSVIDNQVSGGRQSNYPSQEVIDPLANTSVIGNKTTQETRNSNAQTNANNSGKKAGSMHSN